MTKQNDSAWNAGHKSRLRGGEYETLERSEVYRQSLGRCHVCGDPVDPDDWHLDHLVPLAAGGDHTYENVAAAHPICNHRRGMDGHPSVEPTRPVNNPTAFRLSPVTLERLRRMSSESGASQSRLIDFALRILERTWSGDSLSQAAAYVAVVRAERERRDQLDDNPDA